MRDIKYDTVLRKCRENDAAEMYVANTIWPTDEGPVSGKAVTAALATKQPLITPEHKLPAELVEGGGGNAEWGAITGNIANQADLQQELAGKLDTDAVGDTVAGLVDGKVPAEELPDMDYIPTAAKGAANGVAELDANRQLPVSSLPVLTGTSAPTTSTVGIQGQLYKNTENDDTDVRKVKWYICDGYWNNGYVWHKIITDSPYDWGSKGKVGSVGFQGNIAYNGLTFGSGLISVYKATQSQIDKRFNTNWDALPVPVSELDYAVRSVLPNVTTIPAATTAYTLLDASATTNNHSFTYTHVPAEATTYTLPAVTDSTRTHEITLEVLFAAYTRYTDGDSGSAYAWKYGSSLLYTNTATPTAETTVAYSDTALQTSAGTIALYDGTSNAIAMVGSVSFLAPDGVTEITPKPLVGAIKPGCVVQFLCEWDSLTSQWVIYPMVAVEG